MGLYHKLLFHWIECRYLNLLKMFIFVIYYLPTNHSTQDHEGAGKITGNLECIGSLHLNGRP